MPIITKLYIRKTTKAKRTRFMCHSRKLPDLTPRFFHEIAKRKENKKNIDKMRNSKVIAKECF
ncbi:MAG: hypothetical protein S4CHLAM37_16680 [Chlamydiia bacterium]|nr:hypothetical protein [Chlamydiia bacterium]